MARKDLKNRKPLGSAIDNEVFKALEDYSKETKIPKSKILDMAITMYLDSKKTTK